MLSQRFRGAAGVTLAADVAGDPAATSVVVLHGGGQTRHSWGRLARRLAHSDYHVVSLDMRGHGDSDWAPDGDYRLDAFVADLHAVLGQLPQPPVLIGASLGGISALLGIGESPRELAKGLVLVDVVPRMEPHGLRRIREFMLAHLGGFDNVEQAVEAVAGYLPERTRSPNQQGLRKNLRAADDGRLYWHWDPAFMNSDRQPGTSGHVERLRGAARQVRVPTLMVLVSREGADDLLALIPPDARAIEVAGAGYMVAGDRNDAFNDAVETFLSELKLDCPRR